MEISFFENKRITNQRKKLFSWIYIITLLTITFLSTFSLKFSHAGEINSELLVQLANSERTANQMTPLNVDNRLTTAAYIKAYDMLDKQYWAHYGPSGENPWSYILYCGYDYSIAGENLAYDFVDSFKVHQSWMASELHKKNILNPSYTNVGIAIVEGYFQGKETTLIVQLFGSEDTSLSNNNIPTNPTEAVKILYPQENSKINNVLYGIVGVTNYPENYEIYLAIDDEIMGLATISTGTFSIRTQYDKHGIHNLVAEVKSNETYIDDTNTTFEISTLGNNSLNNFYIDEDNLLKIPTSDDLINVTITTPTDVKVCNKFNVEFVCNLKNIDSKTSKLVVLYTNDRSITIPISELSPITNNTSSSNNETIVDKEDSFNFDSNLIPIALTGLGVFELFRYSFTSPKGSSSTYKIILLIIGIYVYFTSKIGTVI